MGAVMSSLCVAISLAFDEFVWQSGKFDHVTQCQQAWGFTSSTSSQIRWRRYVDDVIAASHCYCGDCIFLWIRLCFHNLTVSVVTGATGASSPDMYNGNVWVDLAVFPTRTSVFILPKNLNRAWLYASRDAAVFLPPRLSFLPWLDRMPQGFAKTKALLYARVIRCQRLGLAHHITCHYLCESLAELVLLQYPYSAIRALVHSLPATPAVRASAQWVRAWRARSRIVALPAPA